MIFGWRIHRRTSASSLPRKARAARVFISSTFKDMQRERDILARSVFPKLRERLTRSKVALYEVDLRWGITQQDAENQRAVTICLEEIDACHPLFVCMLGERYGWRPPALDQQDLRPAASAPGCDTAPSITEMEIRRALSKMEHAIAGPRPVFFFRARKLSDQLGSACDDPKAMASLKALICAHDAALVHEYADFETFEAQAYKAIEAVLDEWLAAGISAHAAQTAQELERVELMKALSRSCARSRPVVLTGLPGSGLSSVGRRWLSSAGDHGVLIDARAGGSGGITNVLSDARVRLGLRADLESRPATSMEDELYALIADVQHQRLEGVRIFVDHFEEAHIAEAQADLGCFPQKLPGSLQIVIGTRSARLLAIAAQMRFDIVTVPPVERAAAREYARTYLQSYGKRLTQAQELAIAEAPFAEDIGPLILFLDELRRHGQFDTIDVRLRELVTCRSDDELATNVLNGLRQSLPERFSSSLERVLIAMAVSLKGLEETELCAAASLTPDSPLPAQIWSTLRIGLGRSIVWRDGRADLATGPIRRCAEALITQTPALAREIGDALLDHLCARNAARWSEEAPNIALITGGELALELHLSRVDRIAPLLSFAKIYALGCLERLSIEARSRVCDAWCAQLEASDDRGDAAWNLGQLAAQVGAEVAARRLFELDARSTPQRPDRAVLEVLALKHAASPAALAAVAQFRVPQPSKGAISREELVRCWTQATTIMGLLAEGLVCVTPQLETSWEKVALDSGALLGDEAAMAQTRVLAGQLQLARGQWKAAAAHFEYATRHARHCGHARRLVIALERGAVTALEMQRFSRARNLASECLSIAKQAGFFDLECMAFERLVEVERRTAHWEVAFELAQRYLNRTKTVGKNFERAQACLMSLER